MPRKISDRAIIEALRATMGRVCLAAERLGCSQTLIYKRARQSRKVASVVRFFRGKLLDAAESALWKAVLDGEGWAIRLVFDLWGGSRDFGDGAEAWHAPQSPDEMPAERSRPIIEGYFNAPDVHDRLRDNQKAADAGPLRRELQPRPLENDAAPGGDRPCDHRHDCGTERADPGN